MCRSSLSTDLFYGSPLRVWAYQYKKNASSAWLRIPGMWVAHRDFSHCWLQRRRWRVSYDMQSEQTLRWNLIYTTAVVLSIRMSTCFPWTRGQNRFRVNITANNWPWQITQRKYFLSQEKGTIWHLHPDTSMNGPWMGRGGIQRSATSRGRHYYSTKQLRAGWGTCKPFSRLRYLEFKPAYSHILSLLASFYTCMSGGVAKHANYTC